MLAGDGPDVSGNRYRRLWTAWRGIKELGSARDHPALFDGKDLDPLVAKDDAIAARLADQSARDGEPQ
jgi:hypothetical protein